MKLSSTLVTRHVHTISSAEENPKERGGELHEIRETANRMSAKCSDQRFRESPYEGDSGRGWSAKQPHNLRSLLIR